MIIDFSWSGRLVIVIFTAIAIGACGSSDNNTPPPLCSAGAPIEIGRLCVRGVWEDGVEVLRSDSPVLFQVFPKGCWSSSCTIIHAATCSVSRPFGLLALSLNGTFCLEGTGDTVCTADCSGGGFAECSSGILDPGTYTVNHGTLALNFTVPSTLPATGLCAGDPFSAAGMVVNRPKRDELEGLVKAQRQGKQ